MYYPDEVVSEVRAQNDIIDVVSGYVSLRPRGNNHWGLCPFHHESTPSFSVDMNKQFFYCFGCGAAGNVIGFVQRIENIDFVESLKMLADRVHFILPQPGATAAERNKHAQRTQTAELNKLAARYFYEQLQEDSPEARRARAYLAERGVSPKVQALFGLGLSPPGWDGLLRHLTAKGEVNPADVYDAGLVKRGNRDEHHYYDTFRARLMFPIIDTGKRVVGFGGRIMEKDENAAKYLNSPETSLFSKSNQLYALNLARKARTKEMIVVEGYMDVLALFRAGFTNAVGVLGTALTASHVRLLRRAGCETVLLLLDSDKAGTNAALKAIPVLTGGGLRVKVLQVPDAKDPDEFLQKFGAERLGRLLAGAKSHISFQIGLMYTQHEMEKPEERALFTQKAADLLATLTSEIETDAYVQEIAGVSQIAPAAIFEEIRKKRVQIAAQDGQVIPVNTPRIRNRGDRSERGLNEARKSLVNLLLTNPAVARFLTESGCLPPEEIGDVFLNKLMNRVYTRTLSNTADIFSHLETDEEQQKLAEILALTKTYASESELKKALEDYIKIIKIAYIDNQIEIFGIKNDLKTVKILMESKKSLDLPYITLTDG